MPNYSIDLPSNFADHEWEFTAKGCFLGARVRVAGKQYLLNFYDAARLSQEIESEINSGGIFFEANLVVVSSVTKAEMEMAVKKLNDSGTIASLTPE